MRAAPPNDVLSSVNGPDRWGELSGRKSKAWTGPWVGGYGNEVAIGDPEELWLLLLLFLLLGWLVIVVVVVVATEILYFYK